jgi:hypothetical protein
MCGGGSQPLDPARQALRPGCEELALRSWRQCRRWKRSPPAQNRQGRLLEAIPKAERGVCGGGSQPLDPARQALRPGCEELALRSWRQCRRWKRSPPAQNRHGGAPRGERPALRAQGASQKYAPRERDGLFEIVR